MFSFFSTSNLRAPSAYHRETSSHDRNLCQFYKLSPKIRGALPKTCKISVDFIRLWSQISPEWLKISKNGKLVFPDRFLMPSKKRSGELWSNNYRDLLVSLDPLKCTFWDTTVWVKPPWNFLRFFPKLLGIFSLYFTRLLCVPINAGLQFLFNYLQLFTRVTDWPSLASACHNWDGGPQENF